MNFGNLTWFHLNSRQFVSFKQTDFNFKLKGFKGYANSREFFWVVTFTLNFGEFIEKTCKTSLLYVLWVIID